MYNLFNQPSENAINEQPKTLNQKHELMKVKGLKYVPEFLSREDHTNLWQEINKAPWLGELKRRVQHYGWKYDYKSRAINYSMFLGELPPWAIVLANRLFKEGYISELPDQLIVNEYEPGQGIANHIDCEPCFGDTVISISLGSPCVMDFINIRTKEKVDAILEPRSMVVIAGESRKIWTHGITGRKTDMFNGKRIDRRLRISLTFRKVIVNRCDV